MRAIAVVPGRHASAHLENDAPEPEMPDGHALVRVLETGVCGTDVEIHEGLYGEAPPDSPFLILGHENLGIVESCPAGTHLQKGDLVVSTVRRPCPERCPPCASGQMDMCITGHFRERGISGLHGFMSERYAESPAYLVKLAAHLRPFAVLLEPMSIVQKGIDHAYRIQQRLSWHPRTAVVLGAGPVGILAAAALRLRGLDVTVAALEPEGGFKDQLLGEAGIHYECSVTLPLAEMAKRLGNIDIVFEATGATGVIFPAMRLLGADGVCILSSVTGGKEPVTVDLATWNREMVLGNRVVFGTVNAGRAHFEAGARDLEIAEARIPGWLGRLVTRRLPFTDVAQALTKRAEDIKTVLVFH
jgi:threonine dehydrogenase-like Zn-dependent dehydrogenase